MYTPCPSDPEFDDTGIATSAVDWLGNRFHLGDTVMYCVSAGRGQMMAVGVIKTIRAERRTRQLGRRAESGETPTRIIVDWHSNQVPWVDYTIEYDEITVQVLTSRTSGRWDNQARTRPAWVNPMNITAVTGLEAAVKASIDSPVEAS